MTSPDPEARRALAQLAAIDEELAAAADSALNSLTWDEPLATISQHGLQAFLWYEIPKKWPVGLDEQLFAARALGRLLEIVGFTRYSAICAGVETEEIMTLWDRDPSAGFAAFRRGMDRSGVEPPDLPELTWGAVMGSDEACAYLRTTHALELAIAGGELRPGTRGWKARQTEIARRHLNGPREDLLASQSSLTAVLSERLGNWARRRSAERERMLSDVARRLVAPIPVPEDVAAALEPLCWLLRQGAEGIALTQTGNINRALAREAAERFGWWTFALPPTGENDLPVLGELRDIALELRALRRSGSRRLVATKRGSALATDPAALWRALATTILAGRDFVAAVGELSLVLLLEEEALSVGWLATATGSILSEEGWHDPAGAPPDHRTVRQAVHQSLRRLDFLDLITESGPWQDCKLALNGLGRATALEALRARATGPQRRLVV